MGTHVTACQSCHRLAFFQIEHKMRKVVSTGQAHTETVPKADLTLRGNYYETRLSGRAMRNEGMKGGVHCDAYAVLGASKDIASWCAC